jgi:hypothetical protein
MTSPDLKHAVGSQPRTLHRGCESDCGLMTAGSLEEIPGGKAHRAYSRNKTGKGARAAGKLGLPEKSLES